MDWALRYSVSFLVFLNEITRRILALHSLDKSFESKQTFATIFFSRFAREHEVKPAVEYSINRLNCLRKHTVLHKNIGNAIQERFLFFFFFFFF